MKTTTTDAQAVCHTILHAGNLYELLAPLPGTTSADGILKLDAETWLVGSNVRGFYTLHILEGATKAEAWAMFDSLHGGCGHESPRLSMVGNGVPTVAQN